MQSKISDIVNLAIRIITNTYMLKRTSLKRSDSAYGYYINENFGAVVDYMIKKKKSSLVDLGAGAGHCLLLLHGMGYTVKGYEDDRMLIETHIKLRGNNIEQKDIWNLTVEDIKDYQVIYFYQPFKSTVKMKKFIKLVLELKQKKQVVLYQPAKGELEIL